MVIGKNHPKGSNILAASDNNCRFVACFESVGTDTFILNVSFTGFHGTSINLIVLSSEYSVSAIKYLPSSGTSPKIVLIFAHHFRSVNPTPWINFRSWLTASRASSFLSFPDSMSPTSSVKIRAPSGNLSLSSRASCWIVRISNKVKPYFYFLHRNKMWSSGCWSYSPINMNWLRLRVLNRFADALKTTSNFVVVLSCFTTPWCGKQYLILKMLGWETDNIYPLAR